MLIIAKLEFRLLSLEHMLTKTNSINQIMFSILEAEVGLLCHSSFWRRKEDKSLSIKDSCTSLTGRLSLGF